MTDEIHEALEILAPLIGGINTVFVPLALLVIGVEAVRMLKASGPEEIRERKQSLLVTSGACLIFFLIPRLLETLGMLGGMLT